MPGPRSRLAAMASCLIAAAGVVAPHARAAAAASDTMFPAWQGTSHSSPATGHEFDCSSSNANWIYVGPNGGADCTVSIYTVTTGSNCYHELVSTPLDNLTGEGLYTNTTCQVKLDGYAEPQGAPGSANCSYNVFLHASWQSGVRNELFADSYYAVTAALSQVTTTTTYHLGVVGSPDPLGQPITVAGHYLSMKESFIVHFTSTLCPGDARQNNGPLVSNVMANVYDPVADQGLGTDAGFFQDTIEY